MHVTCLQLWQLLHKMRCYVRVSWASVPLPCPLDLFTLKGVKPSIAQDRKEVMQDNMKVASDLVLTKTTCKKLRTKIAANSSSNT